MNRRELLAGAAKFAGILGTAGAIGKLLEHGTEDGRVPLFATFTVFESLGNDFYLDEETVRRAWSDAFDGKPPCPIICLVGGEIRLHYKEEERVEAKVVLTKEQYHHLHSFTKMSHGKISGLPEDVLVKDGKE